MDKAENDHSGVNENLSPLLHSVHAKITAEIRRLDNSFNFEQLIQKVVSIVHNHFNLYSANLFLVEAGGKWAILRAGTGEVSQIALERGHKPSR